MNNLYEYIDPIASPYEAFLSDSTRDLLPIPAHWHYYVELLYVRKGEIEVSLDNVVSTCTKGAVILFPPKCVHSIALARGSSPVQYDVIKFDPNLLPSCKTDEIDLRAMLHGIHAYRCPCIFSPEQTAQMNLFPLFSDILSEYQNKEFGYSMVLTADLRKIVTKFARIWQKNGDFFLAPGGDVQYVALHLFHEFLPPVQYDLQGIHYSNPDQCSRKYAFVFQPRHLVYRAGGRLYGLQLLYPLLQKTERRHAEAGTKTPAWTVTIICFRIFSEKERTGICCTLFLFYVFL